MKQLWKDWRMALILLAIGLALAWLLPSTRPRQDCPKDERDKITAECK